MRNSNEEGSVIEQESLAITFILDDDPAPPPPNGGWQEIKEGEPIPEEYPERMVHLREATFPKEFAHEMAIVMEAHFVSVGRRFVFAPPLPIQLSKTKSIDGSILACSGGTQRETFKTG